MSTPEPNDAITIITLDTSDDPVGFVSGLVLQLCEQKLGRRAYGRTQLDLHWKNGVLEMVEFSDRQTVKFVAQARTAEEAKARMDALRKEATGKDSRSEV